MERKIRIPAAWDLKIDNYYKGNDCEEAACGGGQLLLGLDFAEKVEGFQHPISYTNYYIN